MGAAYDVGDEVIVRSMERRGATDRTATVTRRGRKYVYVERYGFEVAYDAETGYEKAGRYSPASRILTPQQAAEESERARLAAALKQSGIRIGYDGVRDTISARDMQRLLDVLDNPS